MKIEEAIKRLKELKHISEQCITISLDGARIECALLDLQALELAIKALNTADMVTEVLDKIDTTDWYHLSDGKLIFGARHESEAWYKAEDIIKAVSVLSIENIE